MDILSCLPDEIICHILSSLRTKQSVQTSVLSKRWRFLWARVPLLEFGFEDFDTRTVNIITNILLQYKHDIHTFRLTTGDLEDIEEEFQSWVVNVTTRNIRNLTLDLCIPFELPQCLFTCKTLVDLSLIYCANIPTDDICFPALKKLKVYCFAGGYDSDESFARLISGCPVLEELSIEERMLGHYCVSSPTLTMLDLKLDYVYASMFGMKLDTPALRYLRLHFPMPNIFSVGALDSLIEAHIDLYWDEEHQDNFIYSDNVLSFLGKLYNVKLLTLSMIHDSVFSDLAIKFHNLTELDLHSKLGFITSLLENSNKLRVLKLKIADEVDIGYQYYWMPKQVPACLISQLRSVDICDFRCSEHEFDFIRYILMNAKVLKRMEIHSELHKDDWKKKYEALERLELFERGSQECQLVFK